MSGRRSAPEGGGSGVSAGDTRQLVRVAEDASSPHRAQPVPAHAPGAGSGHASADRHDLLDGESSQPRLADDLVSNAVAATGMHGANHKRSPGAPQGRSPSRPALRWHGGKWLLAPWIISFFPRHRVYVEPFGGAASVLLRKPRTHAEIYNDLDDDVVNLFRVLQDPQRGGALVQLLELTPFARTEFELGWDPTNDQVEQARRLIIRSFMGFGSNAHSDKGRGHKTTGFRANSSRSGTTPAADWANYPGFLPDIIGRLRGVIIERRPAVQVMQAHDGARTLHYVDPPYLPETRNRANPYDPKRHYRHELTVDDHVALLEELQQLEGMVVLSGYPAPLYDDALVGWTRFEREALADGARPRIEVVWINPACAAALLAEGRRPEQLNLLEAST